MATKTKTKVKVKSRVKPKPQARRATPASASQPLPTAAVPEATRVADELFSTQASAGRPIPVGKIQLVVNGHDQGVVDVRGRKLGEYVVQQAERAGVTNFSVYADGIKLNKSHANAALDDATHPVLKLEIVAKDARA